MDNTEKPFTAVEWCAGYAGIHLGLKRVIPNLRVIAFSEIEAFACENLVAKMEAGLLDAAPIWANLKTFPCSDFAGKVDLLVAGYPCQPFSAAGKRQGTEDERHLWPYIATGIRSMRPRFCFFENVEGHITLGLSTVISDLAEMGYKTTWGIFSAAEVGAPHQRKRVFILAYSSSEGLQGLRECGGQEGWEESAGYVGGSCGVWPSRPGQPQYEWEPPRCVGGMENNPRMGRKISSEQLGEDAFKGLRGLEINEPTNQIDRVSECEFEAQWRTEEGDSPHLSSVTVFGEATERHGYQSQGREQTQQHTGEPGICDDSREQHPCESHGADCNARYEQPKSGADGNTSFRCEGETSIPIAEGDCRTVWGEYWDDSSDSFWSELETLEPRVVANGTKPRQLRTEQLEDGTEDRGAWGGFDSDTQDAARYEQRGKTESALGGNSDGTSDRMDNAELYESCDNRVDELRLLGNGVVPATAARAWEVLYKRLADPPQS